MKITPKVAMEICHHEAVVRQAYRDSTGTWTWSVGLTSQSGHNVERYIDNPQTLRKCMEIFVWALDKYADDVREAFSGHQLTEAQFAAALSFHWNTGAIKTASWVSLWRAGDIASARTSFMSWRKPPEIINRRRQECTLFFDGEWSGRGYITEYTKLSSSHRPVWSSATKRDVSGILNELLSSYRAPDAEPAQTSYRGFLHWLLGWLASLGKQ